MSQKLSFSINDLCHYNSCADENIFTEENSNSVTYISRYSLLFPTKYNLSRWCYKARSREKSVDIIYKPEILCSVGRVWNGSIIIWDAKMDKISIVN